MEYTPSAQKNQNCFRKYVKFVAGGLFLTARKGLIAELAETAEKNIHEIGIFHDRNLLNTAKNESIIYLMSAYEENVYEIK